MILLSWGNRWGINGRCDARCHNALSSICACVCGGRYHGGARTGDLADRVRAFREEVLLEAAGRGFRVQEHGKNLAKLLTLNVPLTRESPPQPKA